MGEVPAGKKLLVRGATAVGASTPAATDELVVNGSVEVAEGAVLTATALASTAGIIKGMAGSVTGKGAVVLPYGSLGEGTLTYTGAANQAAGSVVTDGTAAAPHG